MIPDAPDDKFLEAEVAFDKNHSVMQIDDYEAFLRTEFPDLAQPSLDKPKQPAVNTASR